MLSLIILLTLQWAVVSYTIKKLAESQLAERLEREGESLLAGIQFDASGALQVDAKRISAVYQRPFSGHYYVIFANNKTQASRSLWDENLNIAPLKTGEKALHYFQGPEQQPLLIVAHGYQKQQQKITIVMAENLASIQASITHFQALYAAISVAGLTILLIIQRIIVQNALLPLREIKDNIAKLARGEVSQIETNGPEEIAPLIEQLNHLLTGMQHKSRRSRESLGNLAHALKTKLTLLNQLAERTEIDALQTIRDDIYAITKSISQTIERELKRARLMGNTHPMRKVDLKSEIAQLTHTLSQIYTTKAINITWEIATDTTFYGDQEDLLEILGNLLDNACKWCHSTVSLTVTGKDVTIFVVEDDGPGCAEHTLNSLTCRGFRADESQPGSGLGLAIVYDIVESYGASLNFSKSAALGGLHVEVQFTATPAKSASLQT